MLGGLIAPGTTIAGMNVTVGFRPELWAQLAPDDAPPNVSSFEEISGAGVVMPETQHDAWVWIAGGARDVVFDSTLWVLGELRGLATVASETGSASGRLFISGEVLRRDLTGFVDGTENPLVIEAPAAAVSVSPRSALPTGSGGCCRLRSASASLRVW